MFRVTVCAVLYPSKALSMLSAPAWRRRINQRSMSPSNASRFFLCFILHSIFIFSPDIQSQTLLLAPAWISLNINNMIKVLELICSREASAVFSAGGLKCCLSFLTNTGDVYKDAVISAMGIVSKCCRSGPPSLLLLLTLPAAWSPQIRIWQNVSSSSPH